ncbi:MAG: hypothetical protein RI967_1005 [Planctomycetota bacterium]
MRRTPGPVLLAASISVLLAGCKAVPTGAGAYMFTVRDAATGRPIEGVELVATATGADARGTAPALGVTDEDGIAVLAFGSWGAIDLVLREGDARERWLLSQDRVAVNGGKASRPPVRLMVGSGGDGGVTAYAVEVTRVERGGKIDN